MKAKILTTVLFSALFILNSEYLHPIHYTDLSVKVVNSLTRVLTETAVQKLKISPQIAPFLRAISIVGFAELATITNFINSRPQDLHDILDAITSRLFLITLSTAMNYAYNNSAKFQKAVDTLGLGDFAQKLNLQNINTVTAGMNTVYVMRLAKHRAACKPIKV